MKGHQFKLVLPLEVRNWLVKSAKQNLRSVSSEVILAVREKMDRTYGETMPLSEKTGKEPSRPIKKKAQEH